MGKEINKFSDIQIEEIKKNIKKSIEYRAEYIFPVYVKYLLSKYKIAIEKEYNIESLDAKKVHKENKKQIIDGLTSSVFSTFFSQVSSKDYIPKIISGDGFYDTSLVNIGDRLIKKWTQNPESKREFLKIVSDSLLYGEGYGKPHITKNSNGQYKAILKNVNVFNMFLTEGYSFFESPEKIYRRFLSYQDIKKEYSVLWEEIKDNFNKQIHEIKKAESIFDENDYSNMENYNLLKRYSFKDGDNLFIRINSVFSNKSYNELLKESSIIKPMLMYENITNKKDEVKIETNKCEVVEYYFDNMLAIFFNGICVYNGLSYYRGENLSNNSLFFSLKHSNENKEIIDGVGSILAPYQEKLNSYRTDLEYEIHKIQYPMYSATTLKGKLLNKSNIYYEEGKVLDAIGLQPIISGNTVISNLVNLIKETYSFVDKELGTNSYIGGSVNGGIERTPIGVEMRKESILSRLKPIYENIDTFYSHLYEVFLNCYFNLGIEDDFGLSKNKNIVNDSNILLDSELGFKDYGEYNNMVASMQNISLLLSSTDGINCTTGFTTELNNKKIIDNYTNAQNEIISVATFVDKMNTLGKNYDLDIIIDKIQSLYSVNFPEISKEKLKENIENMFEYEKMKQLQYNRMEREIKNNIIQEENLGVKKQQENNITEENTYEEDIYKENNIDDKQDEIINKIEELSQGVGELKTQNYNKDNNNNNNNDDDEFYLSLKN